MDLGVFIGKKVSSAKSELESLGYSVIVNNNSFKEIENSTSLVVRAKLIYDDVIELVTGDFAFLSEGEI